jgi:hypothetical protein
VGFELTTSLRERLRNAIVAKFNRDSFFLFASDRLDVKDFRMKVREAGFEVQVHEFLLFYETVDLVRLCDQLKLARPKETMVHEVVDEILLAISSYVDTRGNSKAFIVGGRVFLNRDDLRGRMSTFTGGQGIDRLLVVSGESQSGKTHSSVLISHQVDTSAKVVSVDLPGTRKGELEAQAIADEIILQAGLPFEPLPFDDMRQDARDGKLIGDRLVQRLSKLAGPTLLLVDNFNSVQLSPSAKQLLIRLCRALERRECPNLWLVLIGLDVSDLSPNYDNVVEPDQACPPNKEDISEFLISLAAQGGRRLVADDVEVDAKRLAKILGRKPKDENWRMFAKALKEVGSKLKRRDRT